MAPIIYTVGYAHHHPSSGHVQGMQRHSERSVPVCRSCSSLTNAKDTQTSIITWPSFLPREILSP